ncbi:MAG: prolipoprotein diacylglyceryl transferase [Clostridia bacterium]|nr:prolipoprotein diacylglyceryl transferase [Clostridia bacterium]
MVNNISFPNLGLKFSVREIAFSVFGREIYWYALILTSAMILGVLYVMWRAKQERISSDTVIDYALFSIVFGIIGARLYYVLTSLENYDSFVEVFYVWEGGLGFYGSIIGGALAVIGVSLYKKIAPMKMFDLIAPAMLIGQGIGRWGNFVNGEAYGSIELFEFFGAKFDISGADLPFVMQIDSVKNGVAVSSVLCQPTFLYESLWIICGFVLINLYFKRRKFDGQILFAYLGWNGFGRMFIEGLRTDSLYIGGLKISQLLGLLFFAVGIIGFFFGDRVFKLSKNIDLDISENNKITPKEIDDNGENN